MILYNFGSRTFGAFQVFGPADDRVRGIIRLLGLGSSVSLVFAFLIGFGSARAGSLRQSLRRLSALFVIGAVHSLFSVDVLHVYAAVGILLLPLRACRTGTLLLVAAALLAVLPIFVGPPQAAASGPHALTSEILRGRDIPAMAAARTRDTLASYRHWGVYDWIKDVAAFWILGIAAGRTGVLTFAAKHRLFWLRIFAASFTGVVALRFWRPGTGKPGVSALVASYRGSLLAVASIAAIVLALGFWQRAPGWKLLEATGRLALTNYLLQSAAALVLFTGVGLGLIGELGYSAGTALALAVFGVQAIWSVFWLRRFELGPVEWILRTATYGRAVRIRTPPSR